MTAVWARLRAELRSGLRSLIALALVLGLFGGVTLAAAAGARRTDSAYARFLAATRPPDVFVFNGTGGPADFPPANLPAILRLPEVVDGTIVPSPVGVARTSDGDLLWGGDTNFNTPVPHAPGIRAKLLSGRLPDPDRPDEIAVGYQPHQDPRVHLGARLQLVLVRKGIDPTRALAGTLSRRDFLSPVHVRVVGVVFAAGELTDSKDVFVGPEFDRRYVSKALTLPVAGVRLRHGLADVPAFQRAVDRVSPGAFSFSNENEAILVGRSTHLLALSLWLFAGLAVVAGLLIFGQALVRRTFEESGENPRLRALGMTRRQLFAVAIVRTAMVGILGAVVAFVLAAALSPVMPLGHFARLIEPHPGFSFDSIVLLGGVVGVVAVTLLVGVMPAWRVARLPGDLQGSADLSGRARPSAVAAAVARAGFPPSAVTGVRLALETGRGRTATPVRSAVVGAALSIGALAAALTFGSSFHHLLHTPRLYGWTWQADTGSPFVGPDAAAAMLNGLRRDPAITDLSAASFREFIQVGPEGGSNVNVWAIQRVRGNLHPTVAEGRWPRSAREIALGSKTLRIIHAEVGDLVPAVHAGRPTTMRVVGRAVFPDNGFGPGLGEGAGVTLAGLHTIDPGAVANGFAFRFAPRTDIPTEIRKVNREFMQYGAVAETPSQGTQLGNLRRIQALPLFLAGLLALAAAAAMAHMLVTSVRRRRRDLAILKTLGFVRRQVSATVAWQATAVVLIALVVGVPLGLAAGRWTWTYFADQIGVVPEPVVALIPALLAIPAALALANLVAAVPGRFAARTRASVVLRSE
ncbi:MAG: FtsX-like permease family protein [Actinomycetota bacterium]